MVISRRTTRRIIWAVTKERVPSDENNFASLAIQSAPSDDSDQTAPLYRRWVHINGGTFLDVAAFILTFVMLNKLRFHAHF